MIAFLGLFLTAGLVAALWALHGVRVVRLRGRAPALQPILRPALAEALFLGEGLLAVGSLMAVALLVPADAGLPWAGALLVFGGSAFEVACWTSGFHDHGFYDRGLWWGRRWIPYHDLHSPEFEADLVVVRVGGQTLRFRTLGPVCAEVRLRLAVEGWS